MADEDDEVRHYPGWRVLREVLLEHGEQLRLKQKGKESR